MVNERILPLCSQGRATPLYYLRKASGQPIQRAAPRTPRELIHCRADYD